jgi:hypothetical protein
MTAPVQAPTTHDSEAPYSYVKDEIAEIESHDPPPPAVNHDPCCFSVNYAGADPSTTPRERIVHWTRMRQSRARFSGSDALCRTRGSAGCITSMSESEFSAYTGVARPSTVAPAQAKPGSGRAVSIARDVVVMGCLR